MDLHDKKILELLRILQSRKQISQRELAKSLKISLGSANNYLKELSENRLILNKLSDSRIPSYKLTDAGFQEKKRLSLRYWQETMNEFTRIQEKINNIFIRLKTKALRRIAFYGANQVAEIAYLALLKNNLNFAGIFDEEKVGEKFICHSVLSLAKIDTIKFNKIVVTVTSDEVISSLINRSSCDLKNRFVFIDL